MDIDKEDVEWLKGFDFDIGLGYDSDALDSQPRNARVAVHEMNYVITDDDSSEDNQETGFTALKEERDEEHLESDTNVHFSNGNSSEFNVVKDENMNSAEEGHEKNQEKDSDVDHIKWSEFKDVDMLSMRFDSLEEAFTFYNEYAKHIGFSVRNDTLKKTSAGVPLSRKLVCSKQGIKERKHLDRLDRKRSSRPSIRCNCPAFIRLYYEFEIGKWVVKSFDAKHNHELAPFPSSIFLRSHRSVSSSDGALAHGLHGVGIKKSKVMDYMIHKAGGFEKVGYIRKDFYNYMDKEKRAGFKGGDAMSLLEHLDSKSKLDPLFRYKYELDVDKRLIRLFWADKRSCADYARFGDVLLFDSTYRTNAYKMAFVLFAGVNNHHQTVIFGCALMASETEEAYTWALRTLVDIMGGRIPKSVITDGDSAIRGSIESVLPSSSHRLFSWHIMQNCLTNIHFHGFAKIFCNLMYHPWTQEQFEDEWEKLVTAYDVRHLNWIQEVYKKRTRWAEAYLHGLFFAGCRSNQRCESLNAMIRHYVSPNLKISQLYQKIEWAIKKIRHRTHEEEVRTLMTEPPIDSHLPVYEKYAASIYTRSSFYVFKRQLRLEALYSVVDTKLHDQNGKIFTVSRYQKRETQYFVEYNVALNTVKCSCTLFESYGFPCRHIISSLKHGDVEPMPNTCILKRWTRLAKEGISTMGSAVVDVKIQSALRYSELKEECNQLCVMGCQSDKDFENVKLSIAQMIDSVRHPSTHCGVKNKTPTKRPTPSPSKGDEHIHEPPLVASKGRPNSNRPKSFIEIKKQKKCSLCGVLGHTRPTCPRLHFEANGEAGGTSNDGFAKKQAKVIDVETSNSNGDLILPNRPNSNRPTDYIETKRQKRCSHCKIPGHTLPTCPSLHVEADGVDSHDSDEVIFVSASRNNIDYTSISQPIPDGYCDPMLGNCYRFA